MSFYIDDAFADDDLTVRVSNAGVPIGQKLWKGIMTQPLSFSSTVDFASQGSDLLDTLDDKLKGMGKFLSLSGNGDLSNLGKELSRTSLRIHEMTIKTWSGTSDPVINVSFAMINTDSITNVFEQYFDLHATLFPSLSNEFYESQGTRGRSLIAPHGFFISGSRNSSGTAGLWNIDVGNWFSARNMILSSVSLDSTLTLDDTEGNSSPAMPMYAAVTCQFTTERAATQQMVRSWLRRTK